MPSAVTPRDEPPPPARRDLAGQEVVPDEQRTTSACAERPGRQVRQGRIAANRLRLRGEAGHPGRRPRRAREPPPPARRDRRGRHLRPGPHRTTSSCAERPGRHGERRSAPPNHLRLRGETSGLESFYAARGEPPPPARRDPLRVTRHGPTPRTTSACAERPPQGQVHQLTATCSPRRRRWFALDNASPRPGPVLSAQAEVVRRPVGLRDRARGALRAGGGGSTNAVLGSSQAQCSPRRRRWFLRHSAPIVPTARRERRRAPAPRTGSRTTSACAERTPVSGMTSASGPHHLRLRGENGGLLTIALVAVAPPPPARRERLGGQPDTAGARTTSACAERTTRAARARGRARTTSACAERTSRSRRAYRRRRTTSACAERTSSACPATGAAAHHLRLREENARPGGHRSGASAPPPPARRELGQRLGLVRIRRTTSACAERTPRTVPSLRPRSHHLRLRGENLERVYDLALDGAPPPPARRERTERRSRREQRRTTSACAERAGP